MFRWIDGLVFLKIGFLDSLWIQAFVVALCYHYMNFAPVDSLTFTEYFIQLLNLDAKEALHFSSHNSARCPSNLRNSPPIHEPAEDRQHEGGEQV